MKFKKNLLLVPLAIMFVFGVNAHVFSMAQQDTTTKDDPTKHKKVHNYDQGTIIADGVQFKSNPYHDSGVIGVLYAGDQFEDCNEVQNNYRQILINKSQDTSLQGVLGWVDQLDTSLQ